MNVVHLNAYYGGSRLYGHLYESLFLHGIHRQGVIAPGYRTHEPGVCKHVGYTVYRAKVFRQYHRLVFPLKAKCYTRYCKSAHEDMLSQADVIHAHTLFSDGAPAACLARIYQRPLVVAVRNSDLNLFYKKLPFLRPYAWNTLKAASLIVTLSDAYRFRLLERLPNRVAEAISNRIRVVPNGISEVFCDNQAIPQPQLACNRESRPLKLLYVGNLANNKNLATLTGAARRLHQDGRLQELRIIGGPPTRAVGKRSIVPNRHGYIQFFGRMTAEELISHYRWADVFVMPSIHETFGLVYAEALSQGTPVVCTKGEGFASWIRDDVTGIAVDNPRNASAVADAILRIAAKGDRAACVADAARFRWSIIAEEYARLYASVSNRVAEPLARSKEPATVP